MTTLEEAAVAFARECLGWADARAVHPDPDAERPRFAVLSRAAGPNTLLVATDPGEAEAAAGRWCDGRGLACTLTRTPDPLSATAAVGPPGGADPLARVTAPDPSQALFAACVEARRRLAADPAPAW